MEEQEGVLNPSPAIPVGSSAVLLQMLPTPRAQPFPLCEMVHQMPLQICRKEQNGNSFLSKGNERRNGRILWVVVPCQSALCFGQGGPAFPVEFLLRICAEEHVSGLKHNVLYPPKKVNLDEAPLK